MSTRLKGPPRQRIGRVSVYPHHDQQWMYYRDRGDPIRRAVGASRPQAEAVASLINARLVAEAAGLDVQAMIAEWLPRPAGVAAIVTRLAPLQRAWLEHHENALFSARGTIDRYRTATDHLLRHAGDDADPAAIDVGAFVTHLRKVDISPNGHANTAKRRLRDKGLVYILKTCRTMFRHGQRHGLIPETARNPFSAYPIERIVIRDKKPVFVFTAAQEEAFFRCATGQAFTMNMVLAKTGLRPAELTHTLVEDLDLATGWLHVRSKPELGWMTKTNRERAVPLIDEIARLLQVHLGDRTARLVFVRANDLPLVGVDRHGLATTASSRLSAITGADHGQRDAEERMYARLWRDAGVVATDWIRTVFIRLAAAASLPAHATCPKSWRHTFATVLQQANVDLLIRQETLGHKRSDPSAGALGMTGVYTHTDPQTQHDQITAAMRLRPAALTLIPRQLHTPHNEVNS